MFRVLLRSSLRLLMARVYQAQLLRILPDHRSHPGAVGRTHSSQDAICGQPPHRYTWPVRFRQRLVTMSTSCPASDATKCLNSLGSRKFPGPKVWNSPVGFHKFLTIYYQAMLTALYCSVFLRGMNPMTSSRNCTCQQSSVNHLLFDRSTAPDQFLSTLAE